MYKITLSIQLLSKRERGVCGRWGSASPRLAEHEKNDNSNGLMFPGILCGRSWHGGPIEIIEEVAADDEKTVQAISVQDSHYRHHLAPRGCLNLTVPSLYHPDSRWIVFTITWKRTDGEKGTPILNTSFTSFGPRHDKRTFELLFDSHPDVGES